MVSFPAWGSILAASKPLPSRSLRAFRARFKEGNGDEKVLTFRLSFCGNSSATINPVRYAIFAVLLFVPVAVAGTYLTSDPTSTDVPKIQLETEIDGADVRRQSRGKEPAEHKRGSRKARPARARAERPSEGRAGRAPAPKPRVPAAAPTGGDDDDDDEQEPPPSRGADPVPVAPPATAGVEDDEETEEESEVDDDGARSGGGDDGDD